MTPRKAQTLIVLVLLGGWIGYEDRHNPKEQEMIRQPPELDIDNLCKFVPFPRAMVERRLVWTFCMASKRLATNS